MGKRETERGNTMIRGEGMFACVPKLVRVSNQRDAN